MKTSLIRCAVAAFALGSTAAVAADLAKPGDFPSRTISIIVPYGPGGGSDQVSRAWAEAMKDVTGVGFQVENKPGGAGLAAMPDFMSRPADRASDSPCAVRSTSVHPENWLDRFHSDCP